MIKKLFLFATVCSMMTFAVGCGDVENTTEVPDTIEEAPEDFTGEGDDTQAEAPKLEE